MHKPAISSYLEEVLFAAHEPRLVNLELEAAFFVGFDFVTKGSRPDLLGQQPCRQKRD